MVKVETVRRLPLVTGLQAYTGFDHRDHAGDLMTKGL